MFSGKSSRDRGAKSAKQLSRRRDNLSWGHHAEVASNASAGRNWANLPDKARLWITCGKVNPPTAKCVPFQGLVPKFMQVH
jgi:hypothetical protein